MIVLSIIAALIALAFIVWFVQYSNDYSTRVYGYEVFNTEEFFGYMVAYVMLYFGYNWFEEALNDHGDILNGILLVLIGLIVIAGMVYNTIKQTSLRYGLGMSLIKALLYAVAAPVVVGIVMIVGAWLMETKPVVRLDDD